MRHGASCPARRSDARLQGCPTTLGGSPPVRRLRGRVPGRGRAGLPPKQTHRAPNADAPRRILFSARSNAPATGLPTPTLRRIPPAGHRRIKTRSQATGRGTCMYPSSPKACGAVALIVRGIKIRRGLWNRVNRQNRAEGGGGQGSRGALERCAGQHAGIGHRRSKLGMSASPAAFPPPPTYCRPASLFAESRSAGELELYSSGQGLAKGGGGQDSRRSIRTRAGQDAPWRIRVRSAVRLLRREACPPPRRHRPPRIIRGIKIARRCEVSLNGNSGASRQGRERRAGQDAPWRIRVRSAVRLLRLEPCPAPPTHHPRSLSISLHHECTICRARWEKGK